MEPVILDPAEWFAEMDGLKAGSLPIERPKQPAIPRRDFFEQLSACSVASLADLFIAL